MFVESNIGKLFTNDKRLYMVTGYNYLTGNYVATLMDTKFAGVNSVRELSKKEEDEIFDYENFEEKLDKIFVKELKLEKYVKIYEDFRPKNKEEALTSKDRKNILSQTIEYENAFNRLEETYNNIKSIKFLIIHERNLEAKEMYKKEIKKEEKGLKRAFKVLYRYIPEKEMETFKEFLEEYDYKNIKKIKSNLDYIKKRKNH